MTIEDVHIAVKLKLDKSDSLNYTSFLPEEIDFWLNQAIKETEKTKFTGNNVKQESLEQTQKRIDDLRMFIKEVKLYNTVGVNKPNSYIFSLPADYLFAIGEECLIAMERTGYSRNITASPTALVIGQAYRVISASAEVDVPILGNVTLAVGEIFISASTVLYNGTVRLLYSDRSYVTQITTDRYTQAIDNPFSQHVLHYGKARPLRLFYNNYVELISDGNYYIPTYNLRYLKNPGEYKLSTSYSNTISNGTIEEGVSYKVYAVGQGSQSVTYNGASYGVGKIFTGVANIPSFTSFYGAVVKKHTIPNVSSHLHDEIISLAVLMMIENVGDTNRFQTNSIQLSKME